MAIFLDTGNIEEIEKFMNMGLIRGVTTNPTILLKSGVTGGKDAIKKTSIDIANLIKPYPLSVEVTTNDPQGMLDQAQEFAEWADNINVKITIHVLLLSVLSPPLPLPLFFSEETKKIYAFNSKMLTDKGYFYLITIQSFLCDHYLFYFFFRFKK